MTQFSKKQGVQFFGEIFFTRDFGPHSKIALKKNFDPPPKIFFLDPPLKKIFLKKILKKKNLKKKKFEKKISKKKFFQFFFLRIFIIWTTNPWHGSVYKVHGKSRLQGFVKRYGGR